VTAAEYLALEPGLRRYNRRMGFLSPVTSHGILRRLHEMRRRSVIDVLRARKGGQPTVRTLQQWLRPFPGERLVIDTTPRLTEALRRFRGAA
jgi:hypothetical protein